MGLVPGQSKGIHFLTPAKLVPVHNPAVAWRAIGEEVVVITPNDSVLHTFNRTGSFVWQQVTGRETVGEIARRLCKEYAVAPETALADVVEFVETLSQKGLLTLSGQRGNPRSHG